MTSIIIFANIVSRNLQQFVILHRFDSKETVLFQYLIFVSISSQKDRCICKWRQVAPCLYFMGKRRWLVEPLQRRQLGSQWIQVEDWLQNQDRRNTHYRTGTRRVWRTLWFKPKLHRGTNGVEYLEPSSLSKRNRQHVEIVPPGGGERQEVVWLQSGNKRQCTGYNPVSLRGVKIPSEIRHSWKHDQCFFSLKFSEHITAVCWSFYWLLFKRILYWLLWCLTLENHPVHSRPTIIFERNM